MVPPVLIIVTFGRSGFCSGGGGATNEGLVLVPVFSIFVAGVTSIPMLYPDLILITMCLSSPISDLGMRIPS